MASQPPWPWLTRDVEGEMRGIIARNRAARTATMLFVRGRRRVGKSTTTKRVLQSCQVTVPRCYVSLGADNLASLKAIDGPASLEAGGTRLLESYATLGAATTVRDAINVYKSMAVAGAIIVIGEMQHASMLLQQLLQGLVDFLERIALDGGGAVIGGLIVLGSRTAVMDRMILAGGSPLYARFTEHLTILPFLPNEMAVVFRRCGITSDRQRVYIELLTGCYPALLQKLATEGLLTNDAPLKGMMLALVKFSQGAVDLMQSDEFEPSWKKAAEYAITHVGSVDSLAQQLQAQLGGVSQAVVYAMLDAMVTKYGILRRAHPLLPDMEPKVSEAGVHVWTEWVQRASNG